MKKLKLNVESLDVEQFQYRSGVEARRRHGARHVGVVLGPVPVLPGLPHLGDAERLLTRTRFGLTDEPANAASAARPPGARVADAETIRSRTPTPVMERDA